MSVVMHLRRVLIHRRPPPPNGRPRLLLPVQIFASQWATLQSLLATTWSSRRFFPSVGQVGRPSVAHIALILALGASLWGIRWATTGDRASGDTFWYARQALRLAGESTTSATAEAARYIVNLGHGSDEAVWISMAETIDGRYPAIFDSRPVYPLVAAAFVPFIGLDGLVAAAFLAGLVFALAIGLVAYAVTGSRLASVAAVVLAYALPSGEWLAFLYADGWMMAFTVISLGCATAYLLRGGRRRLTDVPR
ncbi:MAG: hypothetical protein HYX57_01300 [Chloroflexi bacterium]|nr:hypothetical protein [Chloroflexota bacterium]